MPHDKLNLNISCRVKRVKRRIHSSKSCRNNTLALVLVISVRRFSKGFVEENVCSLLVCYEHKKFPVFTKFKFNMRT